jgi:truncated hemoglobin YjbI
MTEATNNQSTSTTPPSASATAETLIERRRKGDLEPDPEMWAALEQGEKLSVILEDFYTRVFADPLLAHFFHGVTRQRVIEKQYSFMRQIFTGEQVYFGDRPRNAHHWMVISDELFDYREDLMAECLRRAGVAEHLVERWRSVDEIFRKQIVKSEPFPKKLRGVELPLSGYEALELAVGACCDGCHAVIEPGALVKYHKRTGQTYCTGCMTDRERTRESARP